MIFIRGEQYRVIARQRITGCGSKFDGRVKFTVQHNTTGEMFVWLGSRHSQTVPPNARLAATFSGRAVTVER